MRCNPAIRKIAELVEEGAIGWVSAIHADFGLQGPFPAEHRLRDPKLGGGALLDLGVYPINLAHLILGAPGRGAVLGAPDPGGRGREHRRPARLRSPARSRR